MTIIVTTVDVRLGALMSQNFILCGMESNGCFKIARQHVIYKSDAEEGLPSVEEVGRRWNTFLAPACIASWVVLWFDHFF